MIHANAEGVINIPPSCLDILAASAVRLHAFEHEAHLALRRTDLSLADKRQKVAAALMKYGFGGHETR